MCFNSSTGLYSCQLDEQWFNLHKDILRDALDITPSNDNNPFVAQPSSDTVIKYVRKDGREIFGMLIPDALLTDAIKSAPYYNNYLEHVTEYQRYLNEEHEKADYKSLEPASSQPPKPTPTLTESSKKDQAKKRKLVMESTDAPSPTKQSKAGKVTKKHMPKSSLQLVDEVIDEGVLEKEPSHNNEEANLQRALELRKGKEKVAKEQAAHDLLTLQTPKSKNPANQFIFQRRTPMPTEPFEHADSPSLDAELALTDSETKSKEEVHMIKAGDQDEGHVGPNPGEQDEGQAGSNPGDTAESQPQPSDVVHAGPNLEHMDLETNDALIQQKPEQMDEEFTTTAYPNVQEILKLLTKDQEEESRKTNTEAEVQSMVLILIHQDTSLVTPMTTPVIDLTNTTNLILVHRICELELHIIDLIQNNLDLEERLDKHGSRLYKLENLNIPHQVSKAVDEIAVDWEEARNKKRKRRELPRTPPGCPPTQPPPLPLLAGASGALGNQALSSSKIVASASQSMAWTTPDTQYESADIPGAQELSPTDYLMQDDFILEDQVLLSDDEDSKNDHQPKADLRKDWWKPLPEEERPVTPEPTWTIPSSNKHDSSSRRKDVRTHMQILSVVRIKAYSRYMYDYLSEVVLRRADFQEHMIAKKDFKNMYLNEFEDLNLLILQGHLDHLPGWDATGYEFKHDYTIIESPRVVVFPVNNNERKIMRFNKIYKFSDGTLARILEALDYRVKEFKWIFNSLVHSLRALSTLRRSGLRMAKADAKPCQGDSSEFYLITGRILNGRRVTTTINGLVKETNVPHSWLRLDDVTSKVVLYKNMGFNKSEEYKKTLINSGVGTGSVQVLEEVEFEDLIYYHLTRDREQHSAWELFSYREDSNEAAFAVAAVVKIYAHESLTFNGTIAYEVISKWKTGLKEERDAPSDVYVLNNGCKKSSEDKNDYYWEYAPGNVLGMEIVRDQSGNTLRVSQSRFYNGKLVQTLLKGHFILSLEGSLSGDCDVEKNDVGMLDKFNHGLQTNVHVFVDFDYTMERSITIMAGYMTITEAAKEAIGLKGLTIESGFELKIVAGIATGSLSKAIPGPRFQHRLNLLSIGGLKPEIAYGIRMFKPTNLKDATSLARMRDEQLNRLSPIKQASSVGATKNTTMKRLTWDEMEKKRAQSVCFNCDEKFNVGHKCKGPQLLVMQSTFKVYDLDEGDCETFVYQREL
ncbi:hypothetical protein Tco_0568567 [Tanacetum coccineum]